IGKRGHAETGIDRVGASVVDAGLAAADRIDQGPAIGDRETTILVAGAGSMASLAVSTLLPSGVEPERINVTNRTYDRAAALTSRLGVTSVTWDQIDDVLAHTDVLVCATGAADTVFDAERITASRSDGRAMTVIDLALPRDVAPAVAQLP